ncbi:MAG TPA: acyl-CoA dehydrogenase [Acidimicrobiales bacterium]|jgi:alkylation response protein AidB-like acyl-CoA dehydrogenase|nr:acyl-CoA dehydrogenase [Acidimicrobiales bacterium]
MTVEYVAPRRDIRFALEQLVDLPALSKLPGFEHADPETVFGVLDEFGRFVEEVLAPIDHAGDTVGARFDPATKAVTTAPGWAAAYRKYVDAGWGSVPFPAEHGGGGFPWLVAIAMQELLTAANMAWSLCPLLTQGAIDMLMHHGSEEQQERYLRPMVSGEWTGTMNLTEPEAGSDVGALRTRAVPSDDGDGSWRISGQKIFITYGEQDMTDNIVHLVLARVPDAPPGTKGISCFIVPKFLVHDDGTVGARNRVECIGIEHKMGIHASPTCTLEYDGAIGYVIGEPNAGMRYMFTMMNVARLSVGLSGLAVGESAYQQALAYATERRQGRALGAAAGVSSPIVEHADVRRMLLTMRSTVEAMRGIVYANAEAIDLARHATDEPARVTAHERVDLLTPITKAWCTDMGTEIASLAVQIHGGMGYIEETGIAQRYRDIRIAAIYEGTNGIQAMDLVGRKVPMRGGAVVDDFIREMESVDPDVGSAYPDAVAALRRATALVLEHGASNSNDALGAASPYLRMFGLVVGGWVMARQAIAARRLGLDDPYHEAKLVTARFYVEELLPQVHGLTAAVESSSDVLLALTPDQLRSTAS